MVTALVVLGLAMEIKAKGRTSEAIKKLIGLQAKTARVIRDGKEVDGEVIEGQLFMHGRHGDHQSHSAEGEKKRTRQTPRPTACGRSSSLTR